MLIKALNDAVKSNQNDLALQFARTLLRTEPPYPSTLRNYASEVIASLEGPHIEKMERPKDRNIHKGAKKSLVYESIPSAIATDAASLAKSYSSMQDSVSKMRQEMKDGVNVSVPFVYRSQNIAAEIPLLRFPSHEKPKLSILIPAFNEPTYTVECLMSLAACIDEVDFEVILADDASTDNTMRMFSEVEGLKMVQRTQNAGFIRNCNFAYSSCGAPYVLILNNDTQVLPGSLANLIAALDADPTLGAVGPKIIYPNGRLQEAGCFIKPNGESGMVGLFADPNDAGYCHDRDVAYCSGAALVIRRCAISGEIFDDIFFPAYCEDIDLCLRIRAAGYGIRYISSSTVIHHLSVSYNRQTYIQKLRKILRNQQLLTERWGPTLAEINKIRTLAFYLPQFHPTQENNLWWGSGFTEWANVTKARPCFDGHIQPHLPTDLGYYDLRNAETLDAQGRLAARYGIEGFVVYYYNFGSRRVLHKPLKVALENPDIYFRWCLCWANENWTKHWDGGSREVLFEQSYDEATLDGVISDAVEQSADIRYVRVNQKPLFLVYRPLLVPDIKGFAAKARIAFKNAGFPGVHLVYVESMETVDSGTRPYDIGFDAAVEFPPHGRAAREESQPEWIRQGWAGTRYNYPNTVLNFLRRDTVPYKRYPAVFPSWDNTARQSSAGNVFTEVDPESFRIYVEEKIEEIRSFHLGDERLLFINAWNEWAEGAHLEPDVAYGHRWLEALRDAVTCKRWG